MPKTVREESLDLKYLPNGRIRFTVGPVEYEDDASAMAHEDKLSISRYGIAVA